MSGTPLGEADIPSFAERHDDLLREFDMQATSARDLYMRSFYRRLGQKLDDLPAISLGISSMLEHSPNITAGYASNKVLRSIQAVAMPVDSRYPLGREKPKGWDGTFQHIEEDSETAAVYSINLSRGVQTNIANRGKLLKAVWLLNGEQGEPAILDVGCSQNHVLKKLALTGKKGMGYPQAAVMRPKDVDPTDSLVKDDEMTAKLNLLQQTRLRIKPSVGVDLWQPSDPRVMDWARSCSFYPGSLLVPRVVQEYDNLTRACPPEVNFYWSDFGSRFDIERFAYKLPELPEQFDITLFSTVAYQQAPDELTAMIENAKQLTKPSGYIVIQDFLSHITDGGEYIFHENWIPYTYGVWVLDMKKPELGFQKYLSAESGRIKRVILEPAIGKLAVAQQYGITPYDQVVD